MLVPAGPDPVTRGWNSQIDIALVPCSAFESQEVVTEHMGREWRRDMPQNRIGALLSQNRESMLGGNTTNIQEGNNSDLQKS